MTWKSRSSVTSGVGHCGRCARVNGARPTTHTHRKTLGPLERIKRAREFAPHDNEGAKKKGKLCVCVYTDKARRASDFKTHQFNRGKLARDTFIMQAIRIYIYYKKREWAYETHTKYTLPTDFDEGRPVQSMLFASSTIYKPTNQCEEIRYSIYSFPFINATSSSFRDAGQKKKKMHCGICEMLE